MYCQNKATELQHYQVESRHTVMHKVTKWDTAKPKTGNSLPISLVQTTISLSLDTTWTEITPLNLNHVMHQNSCNVYHLLQELLGLIFETLEVRR